MYAADQMRFMGVKDVEIEPFQAIPSTYWGYALSFAAAFTGSLLVAAASGWDALIVAAVLNGLGMWGMLAETDTAPSWTRLFLPKAGSQNTVGVIPASGPARKAVVLCAHIDTHRTPVFNSSNRWYTMFTLLVSISFLSMVAGLILYTLGAWLGWGAGWLRGAALGLGALQALGTGMCLHADFTPYTPGANDNASGVGAVLALARRISQEPLKQTDVHLAITGCEEVGDWGINDYLDRHSALLGQQTMYIILDEIGLGSAIYLVKDGLLIKRATHPQALALARKVKAGHPELRVYEGPGLAYTDALAATRRGLAALTVCSAPEPGQEPETHWHQMSDTLEHVCPEDLENSLDFSWALLKTIDETG